MVAMLAMGINLKAQGISITLLPVWTWISYPNTGVMDIDTAFGEFTPMESDVIKSQFGFSVYENGQWSGNLHEFSPGLGYHYFSNRSYSVTFSFSDSFLQLTVETASPTEVTFTSAVVGGTVTLPEGCHVFLRGVCWGTELDPDIDGNHTSNGTGEGSFSDTLVDLNPNITYYVRAYAVSDYGLAYGDAISFTTESGGGGTAPTGAIDGKFSINDNGDQVYFSQGNLQYQASTNTWKFAESQYDYIGDANSNISSSYDGWIDLFGWGTSGYHDANDPYNVNYQPWSSSDSLLDNEYNSYGYGPSSNMPDMNLTGTSANYDWGVSNPISNGGNTANQWRTLTQPEWSYILNTRNTTSGIRFAKAQVNEVNGVILLPDDWTTDTYNLNNTNSIGASYSSNVINASQWVMIENAGGVFLPAAGGRFGTTVASVGSAGFYWLSSSNSSCCAQYVYIYYAGIYLVNYRRYLGRSVRLVCDVE